MKIVLAPSGSRGDIQPFMAFAVHALAEGHDVMMCASPENSNWAAQWGIPFQAAGINLQEFANTESEKFSKRFLLEFNFFKYFVKKNTKEQFEALEALCKDADAIISCSLQMAAPSIAQLYKKKYFYSVFCPHFLPSDLHPPMMIRNQNFPKFVNRAMWWTLKNISAKLIMHMTWQMPSLAP
jgi:vancomycin aglycone glucosyltransferase